jgi:hypothetical protein
MPDEVNPDLSRLFAVADETLAAEPFVADLTRRLERQRRLHLCRRIGLAAAVLTAGAVAAPFVTHVSLELAQLGTDRLADFLVSPWGTAASLFIGSLVLLRIRALRH